MESIWQAMDKGEIGQQEMEKWESSEEKERNRKERMTLKETWEENDEQHRQMIKTNWLLKNAIEEIEKTQNKIYKKLRNRENTKQNI